MGWFILTDIRRYFNPYDHVVLAYYSNDKADEQRYPFVVVSQNKSMPTPSQRGRLRRQAGLATYPDEYPDEVFFEYTSTGYLDDEGEGKGGSLLRAPAPVPAETTSAMVEAKAEEVIVEGPKPNRREVNGTSNTRGGAKQKPLRRECSRPEV